MGVLAVVFIFKAPDFLRWSFGKLEAQVMTQLPPDLPAVDRERLRTAFADVDRGMQSGKLDASDLQQIQAKLVQLGSKPNRQLTRQDVVELTAALNAWRGRPRRPLRRSPRARPEVERWRSLAPSLMW